MTSKLALVVISALISAANMAEAAKPAKEPNFDLKPLSEVRDELHAPKTSAAEREKLADQAYMFLKNLYVHRELKLKDFGPSADPLPRLLDVKRKAAKLTDEEFHAAIQNIFLDLHDHHTNYSAPLPLSCSMIFSPLALTEVMDEGKPKIVFFQLSNVFANIPGPHTKAVPLDEVVSIDGTPINEYMEQIRAKSGGANHDAMTESALMTLLVRNLAQHPIPVKDTITYVLKGKDGTYEIKSDLMALMNEKSCVDSLKGVDLKGRISIDQNAVMDNPTVRLWRKYVAPRMPKAFSDGDVLDEIARVVDIQTASGTVTVIRLFSFMPESASIESLINRMKEVLIARQETSQGLIIDISGNGGGAVKLAEEMIQLFTPAVIKPMPVTLLPSELNKQMFLNSNGGLANGWSSDVEKALKSGAKLTSPRVLTTPREANRIGQVWFKPVVVKTDASCYSACDLFAAGMQDANAAKIVGIHNSTGAGGANVMKYEAFHQVFGGTAVASNPFKKLPEGQSMRVAWRQTVRTGKNAGKLIEDAGVKPDVVIRLTKEDLRQDGKHPMMRAVISTVTEMMPRYNSSVKLASTMRMANGADATWKESVKGVDSLDIVYAGKVVKTLTVDKAGETVAISIPGTTGTWSSKRFDIVGKLAGKTSFRVVREVFWRGEDIKLDEKGLFEDLKKPSFQFLKTFVSQGHSNADAWQVSKGILRVGKGPNYNSNIVTEAFFPIDASAISGKVALVMDLSMISEPNMDNLNIIARNTDTGERTYISSRSGGMKTSGAVGFILPSNDKNIEVVIEFESDENWNMSGPMIKLIGIAVQKSPEADDETDAKTKTDTTEPAPKTK